jgi:hypothetical protein
VTDDFGPYLINLTQRSNDGRKTKTKERTGNIHSRIHTAVRNCAEDLEWCDRLVRSPTHHSPKDERLYVNARTLVITSWFTDVALLFSHVYPRCTTDTTGAHCRISGCHGLHLLFVYQREGSSYVTCSYVDVPCMLHLYVLFATRAFFVTGQL